MTPLQPLISPFDLYYACELGNGDWELKQAYGSTMLIGRIWVKHLPLNTWEIESMTCEILPIWFVLSQVMLPYFLIQVSSLIVQGYYDLFTLVYYDFAFLISLES